MACDSHNALASGAWWRIADCAAYYRNRSARHFRLHSDQSAFHYGRTDLPLAVAVRIRRTVRSRCRKIRLARVGGKAQPTVQWRATSSSPTPQFEELETFARFGARLDENTRKIIEHGRRIRACLKQPKFAPVSVSAQIAVLLALTAELFDCVTLDRMTDADQAVREAAVCILAEVRARFDTAEQLSDEDRVMIIQIARNALASFQPRPEPESRPEAQTENKIKHKSALKEKL